MHENAIPRASTPALGPARKGSTGVDAPCEAPENPDLTLGVLDTIEAQRQAPENTPEFEPTPLHSHSER